VRQRGKTGVKIKKRDVFFEMLARTASSSLHLMVFNMFYGFTAYFINAMVRASEVSEIYVFMMFISSALLLVYTILVYTSSLSPLLDSLITYSKYKYGVVTTLLRVGYLWSPIALFIAILLSLFTDLWLFFAVLSIGFMAIGVVGLAIYAFKLYREFKLRIFEWSSVVSVSSLPSLLLYPLIWPPIAGLALLLLYFGSKRLYEYVVKGSVKIT